MSASALARAWPASVAFFPAALALASAVAHKGSPPPLSGVELGGLEPGCVAVGAVGVFAPSPGGRC